MKTFETDTLPGRTVRTMDGAEYLWFSGTDYLGMGYDEIFRSYLNEGFDRYGLHFGSSRNNSLQLAIYAETETLLTKWIGSENALLLSSGMWAGQLVTKKIAELISKIADFTKIHYHYAPKVHPALWGENFQINTNSWENWAKGTVRVIRKSHQNNAHIICTDGIGSPLVEAFDFSIFQDLSDHSNVWIIVDESHTLGVCGEDGCGLFRSIYDSGKANVIMVSSLNKALGIPAGVIACNGQAAETFRLSTWFAGASPPAPAYAYALKKLLETDHYAKKNALLAANIDFFQSQLQHAGHFESAVNYPVFCSKDPALFETLLSNGIMASCFSYPNPNDPPVTRLAISTLHQKEDLNRLAEVCNTFYKA